MVAWEWIGCAEFQADIPAAPAQSSKRRVFAMADDSKKYGLVWALAGLGAGAVAGMVCAPKLSRTKREGSAHGAREDSELLRARTRQAEQAINAIVDQSRQQVAALVDQSKQQVNEYVDRSRQAADEVSALVGQSRQQVTAIV